MRCDQKRRQQRLRRCRRQGAHEADRRQQEARRRARRSRIGERQGRHAAADAPRSGAVRRARRVDRGRARRRAHARARAVRRYRAQRHRPRTARSPRRRRRTRCSCSAISSAMKVRAEVEERDVAKIHVGQRVVVRADAYPDQDFEGRVGSIAQSLSQPQHRLARPAPSERRRGARGGRRSRRPAAAADRHARRRVLQARRHGASTEASPGRPVTAQSRSTSIDGAAHRMRCAPSSLSVSSAGARRRSLAAGAGPRRRGRVRQRVAAPRPARRSGRRSGRRCARCRLPMSSITVKTAGTNTSDSTRRGRSGRRSRRSPSARGTRRRRRSP